MYRDLLVGSTGFVGGNLRAKHTFAAVCHSSDIAAQYGTQPDLCVYAGVPAAMFLANADPVRTMPPIPTACLPMAAIACSWNSGCGRILTMPSSCACPRCMVQG